MKENFIKIIQYIIDNPTIGTFLVAVLTFGITFANFYRNRPSIEVDQLSTSDSLIIKPDFIDTETPDVYWQRDYRVIADVIVTNRSAKPISIIEFVLNDYLKFNSYSRPGDVYLITVKPPKEKIDGVTFVSAFSFKKEISIQNDLLKPVIDIPPYTSIRGYLFFSFSDKNDVNVGQNKLEIITSRKTFVKDLSVFDIEKSRLPLPGNIEKVRNQRFE